MFARLVLGRLVLGRLVLIGLCGLTGCQATSGPTRRGPISTMEPPLASASKPYLRAARQPGAVLHPGMEVRWALQAAKDQPGHSMEGTAVVGPDGTIMVGPYGVCKVGGLTMDQAAVALDKHLRSYVPNPNVQLAAATAGAAGPAAAGPAVFNNAFSDQPTDLAWRPAKGSEQPVLTQFSTPNQEVVVVGDGAVKQVNYQTAAPAGRRPVQGQTAQSVVYEEAPRQTPVPPFGQRLRNFFGQTPANQPTGVVYVTR